MMDQSQQQEQEMLLQASNLNNDGAHHILCHRYEAAVSKLHNCLRLAKELAMRGGAEGGERGASTYPPVAGVAPAKPLSFGDYMVPLPAPPPCRDDDESESSCCGGTQQQHNNENQAAGAGILHGTESSFVIYQHAICIAEKRPSVDGICSLQQRDQECGIVSVISIFNLGLAHQLLGMQEKQTSSNRHLLLEKGARLYELAHSLLCSHGIDGDSAGAFFIMAIFNNMAHTYMALGRREMADGFFERLLTTVMYVTECGYNNKNNDTRSLVDFFRGNTFSYLMLKNPSAAAA